jgi:hypothetical protein
MSHDSRKIRFGLWYDFRNPPQWRQSPDRLYGEILDRSHGPRTTDLATFGYLSITSSTTVICHRFCP